MSLSRNCFRLWMAGAMVVLAAVASAQSTPNDAPPVAYASASELNNILAQVKQTAQNIDGDLAKMRVEKWKVDSATKRDVQSTVESIRRNLQSALPEIITQLGNSPEDLAATFSLYRNLDALYDVFSQVEASAEALGSKDEAQNLSNDLRSLQSVRRTLGERMQTLSTAKEAELTRLRNQIKAAQAAAPPPTPKKVVVDDTEPPKKVVKKKAPAKPATTTTTPPAAAPPPSTKK